MQRPGIRYQKLPSAIIDDVGASRQVPQLGTAPAGVGGRPAKRTSKISQKLTLFPERQDDEELDFPVSQPRNRLETERALKALDKRTLPRVHAECVANSIDLQAVSKLWEGKYTTKRFDEVLYATFSTDKPNGATTTSKVDGEAVLVSILGEAEESDFGRRTAGAGFKELFVFEYGVVVLWNWSSEEEEEIIASLRSSMEDPIDNVEDRETEDFNFCYNADWKPRIYNDIILLRSPDNVMLKLTISHGVAQSVKLALFEDLVETTIETTRHIPNQMATTGKIPLSRSAITKKIGQLFIMRINVNLVSNVLDTPELFWSEPALEPFYKAIRGYLEIGSRVEVLNQRVAVISDLLEMLKDHLTSSHGELLEWIVILLIFLEIIIGLVTISIDALEIGGTTS